MIPNLEQYFGLWAIAPEFMYGAMDRVSAMDVERHAKLAELAATQGPREFGTIKDGVGIIEITGALTKRGSSLSAAAGMLDIAATVNQYAADPAVKSILLRIDSPGGTVAGTGDLADAVWNARQKKTVIASVEDQAASAAYWIASQAGEVYANETGTVGSIGTFLTLIDASKANEKAGLKVHVLRSGPYKGTGGGDEITPEQITKAQELVDEAHRLFVTAVSRGRGVGVDKIGKLADGSLLYAKQAQSAGLIDGIKSFDAALAGLLKQTNTTRRQTMSGEQKEGVVAETTAPAPATYQELKDCCRGADAPFICAQLDKKATPGEAIAAWMDEQAVRVKAAEEKAVEAATKADAQKPGVDAVGTSGSPADPETIDDPIAQFNALVKEKVGRSKDRRAAVLAVARENRELHAAYVTATSEAYSAPRNAGR